MATVTLADELKGLLDNDVKRALPRFPEYLVQRFRDYNQLQTELDTLRKTLRDQAGGLFGLGRRMSSTQVDVYRTRVRDLEAQLAHMIDMAHAIRLGYEPYKVPGKWYAGYAEVDSNTVWTHAASRVDPQGSNPGSDTLQWQFSAPMPAPVLEKFRKAKKTGLFDQFIVAAPDRSLFRQVQSMFCEPSLIGYIASGRGHVRFGQPYKRNNADGRWTTEVQPGLHIEGGAGFLIAMWDLEKDRRAAGLGF